MPPPHPWWNLHILGHLFVFIAKRHLVTICLIFGALLVSQWPKALSMFLELILTKLYSQPEEWFIKQDVKRCRTFGPDARSSGWAVRRIYNQLTADATERAGAVIAQLKVSVGSEVVQVSSTLAVLRPQVCWTRQRKQWRYCLQFGFCMSIGASSILTARLQVLPNYKS